MDRRPPTYKLQKARDMRANEHAKEQPKKPVTWEIRDHR